MNLKIYTTYHKDNLIKDYNLIEDNYHILFGTHKNADGENLNNCSKYFNEYSTMYYVWKNNLYSEFVGFEHYRRRFDISKIKDLKNDNVYVQSYDKHTEYTLNNDKTWLLDLQYYENNIKKLYGEKNIYIDYLYNSHDVIGYMCFIINFQKFNEMMIFMHTLIDMFDKDINANYNYNNYLKFYNDEYLCRAHIMERLVSMWILCNYDKNNIIKV